MDGSRLSIVRKWSKEGYLPNLLSFFEEGVFADLMTVYPIHSIPAWVSFATGKEPVNHGIYDRLIRKVSKKSKGYKSVKRSPPNSKDISGETLWEILSRHGKKVGVINLPMTFPPKKINGIMVCGWLTPSSRYKYAYPDELLAKLRAEEYKTVTCSYDPATHEDNFIKEIYELTEKRVRIAEGFMDKHDWDVVILTDTGTEMHHHHYASFIDPSHPLYDPTFENKVKEYYKYVDECIGRLLNKACDANVFIISDHGFTPYYGKIYLNCYLQKWGFLKFRHDLRSRSKRLEAKILKSLSKIEFLRKMVKDFLPSYRTFWILTGEGVNLEHLIDWPGTLAYCPFPDGDIYLNLKGREEKGVIDFRKYEVIRDKIKDKILNEPDFDGIIEDVVEKEKFYNGRYFSELPDLYLKFKKRYRIEIDIPATGVLIEPASSFHHLKENIGYHTINGLFLAKGPDIRAENMEQLHPKIIDIAPTILDLLSLPIPEDMDGRVLTEIFKRGSTLSRREVRYETSTKEERIEQIVSEFEEEIKKRLTRLGYLG